MKATVCVRVCVPVCVLALATLACGKATKTGPGSGDDSGQEPGDAGDTHSGGSGGSDGTRGGSGNHGGRDGESGAGAAAGSPVTGECVPGRTPLRRLTRAEYNNSVREVLGDASNPGDRMPAELEDSGFSSAADNDGTHPLHIQGWLAASETLAATYRTHGNLTLSCAADGPECAKGFIEDMGTRLFRRPVSSDEVTSYLDTFNVGSSDGGTFEEGLEWVLGRMLQSPHFLYRVELESAGMPAGTVVPLGDYSIATRLSYFLWSSAPDPELLAAAGTRQLSTPEGLAAQVQRMMAAPAFETTLRSFHRWWTRWDGVLVSPKMAETVPAWNEALQFAMVKESELFVKSIFDAGGSFQDLLTATHSFVNPLLAQFYGVTYPADGTEFVQVEVPHRAGLLTLPSILAGLGAHPSHTSPVQRGVFIRTKLLCLDLEPPPAEVVAVLPPNLAPDATTRERLAVHSSLPACAECHVAIDPLGLTLEHFDELGRYRETEQGRPIDATGGLTKVPSRGDVSDPLLAPVNGAADLAQQLSELPEARECLVRNWFRFAHGRREESADACTLASLFERFDASGNKLDDLVTGIATSESFRTRAESTP